MGCHQSPWVLGAWASSTHDTSLDLVVLNLESVQMNEFRLTHTVLFSALGHRLPLPTMNSFTLSKIIFQSCSAYVITASFSLDETRPLPGNGVQSRGTLSQAEICERTKHFRVGGFVLSLFHGHLPSKLETLLHVLKIYES